jgi:AcrR family transcriptional regulator
MNSVYKNFEVIGMGLTERRFAEKEQLRQKIFDGASRLIIKDGFEKLSIRRLAQEIEYSPAVIYNYFKNKDDIIQAITTSNYEKIRDEIQKINLDAMEPEKALRTGLLRFAELLLESREHFKATILSGVTILEDSPGSDSAGVLIRILERGTASGDFHIEDTGFAAFLLITGVFGMINMIVLNSIYDEHRITGIVNAYIELLVRGVMKGE